MDRFGRGDGCGKCNFSLSRGFRDPEITEPWCEGCRTKFRDEYRPIYSKWFNEKATTILWSAGVPLIFQNCTLGNFSKNTPDQCRVWEKVKAWMDGDTNGLFLCGPCGTGKSHLAVSTLLELRRLRMSGRFASAQELILECRSCFHKDSDVKVSSILEKLTSVDALVLDDLGAEKTTEFVRETIGLLVDRIYRQETLLIVTSNLDLDALSEKLDDRIGDRLAQICVPIRFDGSSYRRQIAIERATPRPSSQVVQ